MRIRSLAVLLSREILGIDLALPEFPPMKSLRGAGMSDPAGLATQLADKFDYTNTFYHQPPYLDITNPNQQDEGRYDFIISSEVMEHVPPPVERGFEALCRLLKPQGVLILTTPYSLDGKNVEHYPHLHEYVLAAPGGRMVLVNRRKDGTLETFDNLTFHGGDGSTLEIRLFAETELRQMLLNSGFSDVEISPAGCPEFGVEHSESWSLPIVARKGKLAPPTLELAQGYRNAVRSVRHTQESFDELRKDYQRHVSYHDTREEELTRDLTARTEWGRNLEKELEERTAWAMSLEQEVKRARTAYEKTDKEIRDVQTRFWTRLGRKLGML